MNKTPLDGLHRELGARMAPFAGCAMPMQYTAGILAEHRHTREAAGLFDVSHMGQVVLRGPGVAAALERLVPADLVGLEHHAQVYTLFTNESGGVLDDLIVTRWGEEEFFLVVNASRRGEDLAHLRAGLPGIDIEVLEDRALLALQGPAARQVIAEFLPGGEALGFLRGNRFALESEAVYLSCSGYTGEDGFEISLPAPLATQAARRLLAHDAVAPAGLGARDSLRLEAGLCLYGNELTAETTPVMAGLMWTIPKVRRVGGERAGGFPGEQIIFEQLEKGCPRRRTGLRAEGRRPMRAGQTVLSGDGTEVGIVTSAAVGATVGAPIAMAYIDAEPREPGTQLLVDARGRHTAVTVERMPFVPPKYHRG